MARKLFSSHSLSLFHERALKMMKTMTSKGSQWAAQYLAAAALALLVGCGGGNDSVAAADGAADPGTPAAPTVPVIPAVVSVLSQTGAAATAICPTDSLVVKFNEPLDPASIKFNFVLADITLDETVITVVSYDASKNEVTVNPSGTLVVGSALRLDIAGPSSSTGGVKSLAGVQMAATVETDVRAIACP
jgi:hypothetical protein